MPKSFMSSRKGPKLQLPKQDVEAATYLEWSDASLAQGVRFLAADLKDQFGSNAMYGQAAAVLLAGQLRRTPEAEKIEILLGDPKASEDQIKITIERLTK